MLVALKSHPRFQQFLADNHINPEFYNVSLDSIPRYIRVNPNCEDVPSLDDLQHQYSQNLQEVKWLKGFYSLPSDSTISQSKLYKEGKVYGIDVSSAFAVEILDPKPGENVLDLCCAPGAKLCMMADYMKRTGVLTGVDISLNRIYACRKMLYKYKIIDPCTKEEDWRCRLYQADSTQFNLSLEKCGTLRIRQNKSSRARAKKRAKLLETPKEEFFDKVLVDAECTHDGSIRHLDKFLKDGWDTFEEKFLNDTRLSTLPTLQRNLIQNGFNLLRPGGVMVYSTCSFMKSQNEDIVSWFLEHNSNAILSTIAFDSNVPYEETLLPGTIRFSPKGGTSGLYIAKIIKKSEPIENLDSPVKEIKLS